MFEFNRSQIEGLKRYIYHSDIHDSKIDAWNYDREKRILNIKTVNPIFGTQMNLTFKEVIIFLSISGNEIGARETILSLTVEEDYSYFQNCTQVCGECFGDSLYLLFQMFSGDELHIVSKSVVIFTTQLIPRA
ncbi:MAG: hypothetical protein IJW92_05940 [Clostridia bacterium]|nr:hypothetical protein [Clostridia bacterium]